MPETSQEVMDRKIKRLKEHAGDWVSMDIDARIEILKRTIETMKKLRLSGLLPSVRPRDRS